MLDRRNFLKQAAVLTGALAAPAIVHARVSPAHEKSLRLFNVHTGESWRGVFWAAGDFVHDAVCDINKLVRDFRSNTSLPMDPALLVLLAQVSAAVGPELAVHVISGYRSPETNQMLAEKGDGVAKHSLHMEGKAMDIRVPGRSLDVVRRAGVALRGGGVGYYQASQFVHLDTGRLRHW
jgi:uncharacterized protein YcbK (DUF882 family)